MLAYQFCHKEGLKTDSCGADGSGMAVPAMTARPTEMTREVPQVAHVRWDDALLARLSIGALVKLCCLFFAIWMGGNWIAGVPTSIKGIHAVGSALGLAGCVAFLLCGYATVRAWQVRRHRKW
jgi:hypothetical protein